MAISNSVKRNISFSLFLIGCFIITYRIIDPILCHNIDGKGWFDIFGACVATFIAYDNFSLYRKRVKKGIRFGS